MRTLGYMPTEMELIEVSQHVKMRSQCPVPPAWAALGVSGGDGRRGHDSFQGSLDSLTVAPSDAGTLARGGKEGTKIQERPLELFWGLG